MSKVRPDKVATVDEVVARAAASSTAVVTEYRGLTVSQISALRRQLRTLGADYKVFKNTLVRRAIIGTSAEPIGAFLEGPTAIAFVEGDVTAVAKALRDFAKEYPSLVVKGGVLDGKTLTLRDLAALADLPGREILLARLAGLVASPLRTMANLMKAVPQNFAYGLSALIDSKGGPVAPSVDEPAAPAAEAPSSDSATIAAEVEGEVEPEAPAAEATDTTAAEATDTTAAEATDTTEAPAAEPEAPAAEATDITEAPAAEPEAPAAEPEAPAAEPEAPAAEPEAPAAEPEAPAAEATDTTEASAADEPAEQ